MFDLLFMEKICMMKAGIYHISLIKLLGFGQLCIVIKDIRKNSSDEERKRR